MLDIRGKVDRWECVYKECKAKCCSPPKITIGDIKRIAQALNLKPEEFSELKDEKGLFIIKSKNGKCYFLDDDFSCKLHKIKTVPLSCKMFPFLFDGIQYGDDIILKLKIADDCPGHGRGEKVTESFKKALEDNGSKFIHELERYIKLKRTGLSLEDILERI